MLPPYASQIELAREKMSVPKRKRRQALGTKFERGLTLNASELTGTKELIVIYPRANYFELARALYFGLKGGGQILQQSLECHEVPTVLTN